MIIPREVLKAIQCCCGEGESHRFMMAGLELKRLSENRCQAATVDGVVACVVRWTEPPVEEAPACATPPKEGFQAIVSGKEVAKIGASKLGITRCYKPILANVFLNENQETPETSLEFVTTDLERTERKELKPLEGKFPNLDLHYPSWKRPRTVTLNARKLRDVLTAMITASGADETNVRMTINTQEVVTDCGICPVCGAETNQISVQKECCHGHPFRRLTNWVVAVEGGRNPIVFTWQNEDKTREVIGLLCPFIAKEKPSNTPRFPLPSKPLEEEEEADAEAAS